MGKERAISSRTMAEIAVGGAGIGAGAGVPTGDVILTGAAEACKQAVRCGARTREHAYLIDEEAIDMAARSGTCIVPSMWMTRRSWPGPGMVHGHLGLATPS